MIRNFHVLYVGQIELDNIGRSGTPANERRYSAERLREEFNAKFGENFWTAIVPVPGTEP